MRTQFISTAIILMLIIVIVALTLGALFTHIVYNVILREWVGLDINSLNYLQCVTVYLFFISIQLIRSRSSK